MGGQAVPLSAVQRIGPSPVAAETQARRRTLHAAIGLRGGNAGRSGAGLRLVIVGHGLLGTTAVAFGPAPRGASEFDPAATDEQAVASAEAA